MVDVGVGEEDIVDQPLLYGKLGILIDIRALLHTVVQQDRFPAGLYTMAAAGDFVIGSDEGQLH